MRSDITAVILAGGRSLRFGSNKALARLDHQGTLIETLANMLKEIFADVFVLTKEKKSLAFMEERGFQVLTDRFENYHPLNGLASALSYAKTEKIFLCACDMPFLNPDLIRFLCSKSDGVGAVVPFFEGHPQPLCGVYSKTCFDTILKSKMFEDSHKGVRFLLDQVNTRYIEESEWRAFDSTGRSFFDIDTPEQLNRALAMREESCVG